MSALEDAATDIYEAEFGEVLALAIAVRAAATEVALKYGPPEAYPEAVLEFLDRVEELAHGYLGRPK